MAGGVKQPREYIGEAACPLCARAAPVRQQANGFAILKCGFCNATLQAQDHRSNMLLRKKIVIQPEDKAATPNVVDLPPKNVPPADDNKKSNSMW